MRFDKKDDGLYIIFENDDQPIYTKEDGTLWWDTGRGLKLQLHFDK